MTRGTPLENALAIVVALLLFWSYFLSQRAESARAQHECARLAIYEQRRGRQDRASAYMRAGAEAYMTGHCSPRLVLEVELARE